MSQLKTFRYEFSAMASPCRLQLCGTYSACQAAAQLAQREVQRLEQKYSRYLGHSVASWLNRQAAKASGACVDAETAGLLDYADVCFRESSGLFDITSGVLGRIWDFKRGKVPDQQEIDAILPLIGWDKTNWSRPVLKLPMNGMQLDFGGYVKEYAADAAAAVCRTAGIEYGLINLGGDVALVGPRPDGSPWRVAVRRPAGTRAVADIALTQGAIATSGDYERNIRIGKQIYSHVLNPISGWPSKGFASVSVVAPSCVVAGTASTVALLKGETAGRDWLETLGLPWLAIRHSGEISGTLA